ncbi:3'(2'),5'-bisphosphate nucleotidase CysQ [Alistipes communis]|uniref:3'(2'),5'-bisphosphate nucleotidase CysQ n=2 Tax=Alistipes communis TaxID=2585118 RepID=A0A4Y1WSA6_9BACT|nr:3'(2'),5'-bisphosphate nucleotidase CysQ [Alistipes communis]BBL02938.1 3'(2'),5'-bisphosphate nucleotidase CysQ [Alistipes communis]
MLSEQIKRFLLPHTFNAAVRAGAAVMRIYEHRDDYDLSKYDGNFRSITAADRAAHEAIKRTLGQTRIPILSEDGREMHYEERCNWELFWLVDPLDGTREFIAGNNEFTINIALMENNVCAAAVIYVPYLHKIYFADRGFGSYVRDGVEPSADAAYTFDEIKQGARRLPLVAERHAHPLIAISRSHNTPETFAHVEALRRRYPDAQVIEQGSSYKFCLLAEGRVDYYVRTTHTYEWDTAAGELILAEAGGRLEALADGAAFRYNKRDLQNPWFVCRAHNCAIG